MHVVHEATRGHIGRCVSCGVGIIHGKASKQKLNKKSTTESGVVAVSEYVPYKIHMIDIFLGQGYVLNKRFGTKTTKVQLRWIRTAEIHA